MNHDKKNAMSTDSIRLRVDGPPVGFRRHIGTGRRAHSDPGYARYRRLLADRMAMALPRGWDGGATYALGVIAYVPDLRRRDVDNLLKSVMDAGNGIVWADDSQVTIATVARELSRERPGIEIAVKRLEPGLRDGPLGAPLELITRW
jgi:Holliday junction resolvase RusA-like endonuclease